MSSFQSFKERIRREVSLDSYIGKFVSLKKTGKGYVGLCPFHSEKTPSFHVNSSFYHCFGCKASGDIIRFVMEYQRVDFTEALRLLADFSGIALQEKSGAWEEEERKKESLYQLLLRAEEYFRSNMFTNMGRSALEYAKERGLTDTAMEMHRIGFALPGFSNLRETLLRNETEKNLALQAGLTKISDKSKEPYDFFRNRLVFPILDSKSRVIGFSARVLPPSEEAKYINSPNSLVYDKGRSFYNINLAIDSIRKHRQAVVVEGVLDAIGLYQKGLESAIAPLGTGFTESHAKVLRNLADRVYLMMDADKAGRAGAFRAAGLLKKEGLEVRMIRVPEGKDPFEFSHGKTKREIQSLLEHSEPVSQFMISEVLEGANQSSPAEEKQKAVSKLFGFLKPLDKETDKQVYLEEGAKQLGISFSALLQDFQGGREKSSTTQGVDTKKARTVSGRDKLAPSVQAERKIIAKLIYHPELFSFANKLDHLTFTDDSSAFLWEYLYSRFLQNDLPSIAELLSSEEIPGEYSEAIAGFLSLEEIQVENQEVLFGNLLHQHQIFLLNQRMEDLNQELSGGDPEKTMTLLSEIAFCKAERDKIWDYLRKPQIA